MTRDNDEGTVSPHLPNNGKSLFFPHVPTCAVLKLSHCSTVPDVQINYHDTRATLSCLRAASSGRLGSFFSSFFLSFPFVGWRTIYPQLVQWIGGFNLARLTAQGGFYYTFPDIMQARTYS